ncbi:Nn.00g111540.m01.CDS01 [Neocucurbitaria sp. VM-36]
MPHARSMGNLDVRLDYSDMDRCTARDWLRPNLYEQVGRPTVWSQEAVEAQEGCEGSAEPVFKIILVVQSCISRRIRVGVDIEAGGGGSRTQCPNSEDMGILKTEPCCAFLAVGKAVDVLRFHDAKKCCEDRGALSDAHGVACGLGPTVNRTSQNRR